MSKYACSSCKLSVENNIDEFKHWYYYAAGSKRLVPVNMLLEVFNGLVMLKLASNNIEAILSDKIFLCSNCFSIKDILE